MSKILYVTFLIAVFGLGIGLGAFIQDLVFECQLCPEAEPDYYKLDVDCPDCVCIVDCCCDETPECPSPTPTETPTETPTPKVPPTSTPTRVYWTKTPTKPPTRKPPTSTPKPPTETPTEEVCYQWVCHKTGKSGWVDYCCDSQGCVDAKLKQGDKLGRCVIYGITPHPDS